MRKVGHRQTICSSAGLSLKFAEVLHESVPAVASNSEVCIWLLWSWEHSGILLDCFWGKSDKIQTAIHYKLKMTWGEFVTGILVAGRSLGSCWSKFIYVFNYVRMTDYWCCLHRTASFGSGGKFSHSGWSSWRPGSSLRWFCRTLL